uniref:Gamma-tubulin complex component n=1 Tax=Romanomermis culicivorax TaxID=13658 RepID=A0A915IAH7_ROMCU
LADDEELKLNLEDVRLHRLESFLDLAIRSSLLVNDALKDEIKLNLKSTSLTDFLSLLLNIDQDISASSKKSESQNRNLKACDALTLKFDAQWPLSIIFNRKVMLQYEIIFRRLLQCKYVEKLLSQCWISRKFRLNPLYSLLLHQMLTFLKNYLYFATAEVIEPNWHKFYANFSTIDQALKSHALFLDDTTKDCLLTDGILVQNFQKILDICLKFARKFDENLDNTTKVEDLKFEFDGSQMNMLQRMQILSASSKERLYTDIAYRLDLK